MAIPYHAKIVNRLRAREQVKGIGPGGGFAYTIDFSVPYIVTAIHAGHAVREELLPLMALDEQARRFEEDTATDEIIRGNASTIHALDSRAEYDLNRPESSALPLEPEKFWGLKVYHNPPSEAMNQRSLEKHREFYRFMAACLTILIERHGRCVVYDIHSYNISRQQQKGFENPPVFNLGTALLDKKRWGPAIDGWLDALRAVTIPGMQVTAAENLVFEGKAELCRRLTLWNPNILVLPTEISKLYMDEHTGRIYRQIVHSFNSGLQKAIAQHQRQLPRS
jgi:hypothetical protein